jgi:tRNA-specific adenosine deaminase 3
MGDDDAREVLAEQEPIVQELIQDTPGHGVLIPLKTTLELGEDHVSGRVLITRAPTKCANPVITYAASPTQAFPLSMNASLLL